MNPQLLSTAGQSLMDFASNALQNKYNRQQIRLQNKLNVEQWNRQNEYNSPLNQMARFQAAGLNPNLIYGQGNPGNAAPLNLEAPAQAAPKIDALGKMAQVIAIQNAKAQHAYTLGQIQLQQTQNEVMQQRILESRSKVNLQAAVRGLTFQRGDLIRKDMAAKYGEGNMYEQSIPQIHEYSLNAMRLKNAILEQQLQNLGLDATLKSDVHNQKAYEQQLRDFGIERGDNVFIRAGLSLWNKAKDEIMRMPLRPMLRGKSGAF